MLVLSRKEEERIVVGPDIELVVLEVRAGRVKIGIRAPEEMSIYREELLRQTESEKTGQLVRASILAEQ